MRGFTVVILAFALLFLGGCSEKQNEIARPLFGDGGTLGGQNATVLSGSGPVSCTAVPAKNPVSAGERFLVKVTLTAGKMPFSVVGFIDNIITSSADVWGLIPTTGTATRRINVRAANGSASCLFSVLVN